ncbi:MAG TPA: 2-oxoacid:acceptor oxidoreductase family protein, partial [Labilithrix sp.]|nr:2-oxoacid:acceptor oxidoreductase family protein [Labilithrix sp.]
VIYDSKSGLAPEAIPLSGVSPHEVFAVPLGEMARTATGTDKAKNTVVLGLLAGWFGIARKSLLRGLEKKLARKGRALVAANERAFILGEEFARDHPLATPRAMDAPDPSSGPKLLSDGNDMCAAAAIFAGCELFAGYPITPSSEVMQLLSREIWKYGGAVLQCEDEMAGIGAALGASFAGKKAMTATSGPGLSLKTEIMGLATMAELPLVILDVQRGGPSTGLPTKPEQADLFAAAFSGHGDVLRPILAPTSVADTLDVTVEAFNIAEHYQTPVLILSDQEIAQRKETVDRPDTSRFVIEERKVPTATDLQSYVRFRHTEDGISPLSHPGMAGGTYQGAGIEHNERGNPTASGKVHAAMNDKRFRKLAPLRRRRDLFRIEGNPSAKLALVAWGSVAGVCREALARAQAEGLDVKLLVPLLLYPIAEEIYRDFFASVKAGFVVELSHQGQLFRILRMFTDVPAGVVSHARSGANPFQPEDLLQLLRTAASSEERAS